MPEEKNTAENTAVAAPAEAVAAPAPQTGDDRGGFRGGDRRGHGGRGGPRRGGPRKGGDRPARIKPEYDSKMLNIRRVARVVAGGRRFNFSVALVAGNRKGMVGVGIAKAGDTAQAIDKAFREAKKNLVKVNATPDMSIPHETYAKYSSARVMIKPAKDRGVAAGSAVRTVLELAGVKNVVAKIVSPSKNKLNIARATVKALEGLRLEKPISAKK